MGARTAGHLPYADRFGAWERSGVKVTPVFSQARAARIPRGFAPSHLRLVRASTTDSRKRRPTVTAPVPRAPRLQGQGGCYVQDAFAAGGGIKDPATTGAVIVGQKPMAEAITGMLMAAGVPKERILFNF